jgi:hypothetical protein
MLAVLYTHTGLSFDIVEILGGDEGYFAYPAEAAPVTGPSTVAVTLQTAAFESGSRPNTLHLCTTFRSKEYTLHQACHYQPSLGIAQSFRDVLQYPVTVISQLPISKDPHFIVDDIEEARAGPHSLPFLVPGRAVGDSSRSHASS